MKRLIYLITCLAAMACSHAWQGETDLPGHRTQAKTYGSTGESVNHVVTSKRQSQFEDCLAKKKGMDEAKAKAICKAHVEDGMPNNDPQCDDCVDNPLYGWDRFYGGYGYNGY